MSKKQIKKLTPDQENKLMDEMIDDTVKKLEMFDSPEDALSCFIKVLVGQISSSHFSGVGILEETLLSFREQNLKMLNEDTAKHKNCAECPDVDECADAFSKETHDDKHKTNKVAAKKQEDLGYVG